MKKLSSLIISLMIMLLMSCSEDELLDTPDGITASQGTYVGTVFLNWNANGVENHEVLRKDPISGEWKDAGFWNPPPYWDYGYNLPTGAVVPGEHYEYKVRGHRDGPGYSEYSEVATGYAFLPQAVSITDISRTQDDYVLITWSDPNNESSLVNLTKSEYVIYRSVESDISNFYSIGRTEEKAFTDINPPEETAYYKIAIRYECLINESQSYAEFTGEMIKDESGGGSGGNEVVDYTKLPLTDVSGTEGITFLEMKVSNNKPYLGLLDGSVSGGIPAIYELSGTSWEEAGGALPAEITAGDIIATGIAAGSSDLYIAGLSGEEIYVYQSDGSSWSTNLTNNNMGFSEPPSTMDIEALNDEIYLAVTVEPDWDLKIYKWDGSSWATVGGDANGWIEPGEDVSNVVLENFGGTLYLYYLIHNNEDNATLKIKHLSGNTWETDLEWSADYLYNIQLAKGSSSLYFTSSTTFFSQYRGGVYQVISTTSVETLADQDNDWFYTPYAISVDSQNTVIISSQKIESQTLFYPSLSLFDGTDWKTVSGDFSDGADPVALGTIGTDIYYVYGDVNSENSAQDPSILLTGKYSK